MPLAGCAGCAGCHSPCAGCHGVSALCGRSAGTAHHGSEAMCASTLRCSAPTRASTAASTRCRDRSSRFSCWRRFLRSYASAFCSAVCAGRPRLRLPGRTDPVDAEHAQSTKSTQHWKHRPGTRRAMVSSCGARARVPVSSCGAHTRMSVSSHSAHAHACRGHVCADVLPQAPRLHASFGCVCVCVCVCVCACGCTRVRVCVCARTRVDRAVLWRVHT